MTAAEHALTQSRTSNYTRTVSITSGKGGVGKTSLTANLASALAQAGQHVLILDGDWGMANIDIMFGVRADSSVYDVFVGAKDLHETIMRVAPNIDLIPGGSGLYELQNISAFQKRSLMDSVKNLPHQYDIMLVDTPPGIDDKVLYLNASVQDQWVIITPDPASLTDAYALIKVLHQRHRLDRFSIVVNQVRDEAEGQRLFQKFFDVVDQFLCVRLDLRGVVPLDIEWKKATRQQKLVWNLEPRSVSSGAVRELVKNFNMYKDLSAVNPGGLQFFWEQMVGVA